MKRISKNQMTEIVTNFLERRNYGDSIETTVNRKPIKSKAMDHKSNQSLAEVALKGSLVNSSSDSDVICLSQSVNDFGVLAETAYKQFINFVERFKSKQRLSEQLLQLEFPLFVYLFIEMFECGHRMTARRFYREHKNRFKEVTEQQIIGSMYISLNNLNLESSLKNFKSCKYSVKISDKCLEQLKKFFKETKSLVILQILNVCIEFNLYSTHNQSESEKRFDSTNYRQSLKRSSQYNELDFMPSTDLSLDSSDFESIELKKTIERLRNTDPCVPPVCKYTINNTNVCSGAVADDMSAIGFGFEDSMICLKRFGPNNWYTNKSDIEVKRNINKIEFNAIDDNIDDNSLDYNIGSINGTQNCDNDSSDPSLKILRGHSGAVYDLTFYRKNNLLLSTSFDTTVRAWDTITGDNVVIYNSHLSPVFSIDLSPIGDRFVTGAKDSTSYLWSLERSNPIRIFCGHNDSVNCVRFHPNCSFVATASADKDIKIWDISKATAVRTLVGHEAPVYCLAFSTDGHYLASGGEDRKVKIWDLKSQQMVKEFSGHTDAVFGLTFNHCNEVLASCSADQTLKIWNFSQLTNTPESDSTQNTQRVRKELLKTFRLDSNPIYNRFMPKDLLVLIATKTF